MGLRQPILKHVTDIVDRLRFGSRSMSTRLKKPALWRTLLVTVLLIAFQGYLGFNVIGGQFGIESQKQMRVDIETLKAQSADLAAQVDTYRHKASLFDAASLDPDVLTEKARALAADGLAGRPCRDDRPDDWFTDFWFSGRIN